MGATAMSTGTTTNGWQDKSLLFLTYVNTGTAAVPDWAWVEHYWNNTTYYYTTVYSTTAAGTAAKVGSTSAFTLTAGRHFMLMTTTGNSYAGKITLNVSSTGAKDVWINGAVSSSTNYNLPKGIYLVYYDGTNYHIRTDGKIPHADINFSVSATAVDETNLITQYNGTDSVVLKLPQGLSGFARINSTEFVGSLLGNADTATKLKTPRTIALTGAVTGSGSFDGSGNLSIATTANHTHYYLATIGDQRSTATTPNTYNNQFIFQGLKTNSSFGAPSTDTYSYVLGLRGWSDSSGGKAWELAFNNTGIFARTGATTAWEAWKRIPFGDGTGASGTWGINISGNAATASKVNQSLTFGNSGVTFNGSAAVNGGQPVYYIEGSSSDATGLWTMVNAPITTPYNGLTIIYIPKVAGQSSTARTVTNYYNTSGVLTTSGSVGYTYLKIGDYFYPCYYTSTSQLTTQYAADTPILFTFYDNKWKRADYNSNTNTLLRTYASATNIEVPLIAQSSANSTTAAWSTYTATYKDWYGAIPNDDTKRAKINLSTGHITAPGGITAALTGNASTATKFASAQSITLTGDTTGSASSQAGWSISTTTKKMSSIGSAPSTAGTTVAQAKTAIHDLFANNANSKMAIVQVPSSYVTNWNDDTATYSASSVHSFISLSTQYNNNNYGEFLVSSYGANNVGHVGLNNSTWTAIKWFLDSTNYTSYTVTKTGSGASGTWGISISGTATNATNVNIADDTSSKLYVLGATTTGNTRIYRESSVYMQNNVLMGAAWNDYAEYRMAETKEPGRVVCETSSGKMVLTTRRLQPACEIISDTFGFAIGQTEKSGTPIAATGRVLAYTLEPRSEFELGDAVCSGPNGTVSHMTRAEIMQYPERIIGTVSEIPSYDTWGENNIKVNNRIWIRIR